MDTHQETIAILREIKNDPHQLINKMLELQRQYSGNSDEFLLLISEFINTEQLDIFDVALRSVNSGINIFNVASLVVMFFIKIDIIFSDSLLDLLIHFYEKAKNDLASSMFYEPIQKLASITDKNIDKIEMAILARRDPNLYGYLSAIYVGIISRDFIVGYEKILKMINSADNDLVAAGLRALGMIPVLSKEKIQTIQNKLIKLCSEDNMLIASSAIFALCKLAEQEQNLKEQIIIFSKSTHPEIQYEIAKYMQSKTGDMDNDDINLILNLCGYDLKWQGISQSLDYIIFDLTGKNRVKESVQIINKWISSHSMEALREVQFDKLFHFSINNIIKNKQLMSSLSTDWLNSDDLRFHHVLTSLFSYLSSYNLTAIELNPEVLINLEYNDLLYIMRKALGYIYDYETSIYLVSSILRIKVGSDVENLVKSVLIEQYGYKHPFKTIEILKNLLKKESTYSANAKKIFKFCLNKILEQNKQKEDLDKIAELQPNLDHQIKLNSAIQKSISNASVVALNSSPLLGSINKIYIREGHSWFSYNQGQPILINKMTSMSHTIEVPRGEILDEIGSAMERFNFRRIKRGES